ncbi:TIGR02452 family protein [Microscilla marina]|uniref:Microbial-type PARG catalytic domain-containing protein n=1 Tax=Microscilla marina ATCC 23134 TaxID=313606 RepID=A1ZV16_MICM2|nr:TIGR02452 family protein [Microscilla marina]EAY25794.1 conserved hypothetical protein [Microscilla marina ATCC 23134]
MSNRKKRAEIAQETLQILAQGKYIDQSQNTIDIKNSLTKSVDDTLLYTPTSFDEKVLVSSNQALKELDFDTQYEVTTETTLQAAKRLVEGENYTKVGVLNFASAKNPGGGFLGGSQAQEESLARASGLYACLEPQQEMYLTNRKRKTGLYLDYMVYSPDVPVFRNDDDQLLNSPYMISVITAPAVNAGSVKANYPAEQDLIATTMLARTEKVLTLAVLHQHEVLVLGAWGCGVFKNNPKDIAQYFATHLFGEGKFNRAFRKIVFAVYSGQKQNPNLPAFEKHFGHEQIL